MHMAHEGSERNCRVWGVRGEWWGLKGTEGEGRAVESGRDQATQCLVIHSKT